jgi:hypothetical protein
MHSLHYEDQPVSITICNISDLSLSVNEVFTIRGCYAAYAGG